MHPLSGVTVTRAEQISDGPIRAFIVVNRTVRGSRPPRLCADQGCCGQLRYASRAGAYGSRQQGWGDSRHPCDPDFQLCSSRVHPCQHRRLQPWRRRRGISVRSIWFYQRRSKPSLQVYPKNVAPNPTCFRGLARQACPFVSDSLLLDQRLCGSIPKMSAVKALRPNRTLTEHFENTSPL